MQDLRKPMTTLRLIALILTLLLSFGTKAQSELVLKKGYSAKTIIRIHPYDVIQFKIKGSEDIYKGPLLVLGDSSFFFDDQTIKYNEVTDIYLKRESFFRSFFLKGVAQAAIKAPLYLMIYGNINALINKVWDLQYLKTITFHSAMIEGSGLILKTVEAKSEYRRYTIGKYRLVLITYP